MGRPAAHPNGHAPARLCMGMAVLLYDLPLSHYCVAAKKMLAHKGVAFATERAPYHDRQDLLAVSGQDYVPYLLWEDEGVVWGDIPAFLEGKVAQPTLYPDGQRHVAEMLAQWAHGIVEEAGWKCVAFDALKTFDDARERWVFEEIQTRTRGPLEVLNLQKQAHLQSLVKTLAPAEARLGETPYLLGADVSRADFALYGALHIFPFTGNKFPDALTNVRAWWDRVDKL